MCCERLIECVCVCVRGVCLFGLIDSLMACVRECLVVCVLCVVACV